jgi:DNA-binding PadR family transcriptional regulator
MVRTVLPRPGASLTNGGIDRDPCFVSFFPGRSCLPEVQALTRSSSQLTDDEGTFLALLVRIQPATAYQIAKIYEQSPVSNFGTSKGKIYPLLRRLKARGFISARAIAGTRNTEVLRSTARGREGVRQWVKQIKPVHVLPEDPLRTMVQSFDLLSKEEQLEWISGARAALESKLAELDEYASSVVVPYKEQVHDNAVSSVECRLAWLDRLEASLGGTKRRARG